YIGRLLFHERWQRRPRQLAGPQRARIASRPRPHPRADGKLAGLPRPTWSNLESGTGNPTLTVLHAVCSAFQVSLEEIVAEARANACLYPKGTLPLRTRGEVQVSSLLPDEIPGMQIERLELPVGSRMVGVPHT